MCAVYPDKNIILAGAAVPVRESKIAVIILYYALCAWYHGRGCGSFPPLAAPFRGDFARGRCA
jgi:hypothetical protein